MYLTSELLVKPVSIPEATFKKLHGADLDPARLTPEYVRGYIGFLEVSYHLHASSLEAYNVEDCGDLYVPSTQYLSHLRMGVHEDYHMKEAPKPAIFRDRPWTMKLHFGTPPYPFQFL